MWFKREARTTGHHRTKAAWKAQRARLLWIGADVAAVTALGGTIWWQWLNIAPTVSIPAPSPPPASNAFDTFTQAGMQITHKDILRSFDQETTWLSQDRKGVGYSAAEKEAAVAANASSLALLHTGFRESYRFPARRGFPHFFREYEFFQNLSYLKGTEGQVREQRGDLDGAAQSWLDLMQLGVLIPRGGDSSVLFLGGWREAAGRGPLGALADRLTGPEARAAARRLETITAQRVPLADALTEEKWNNETWLRDTFREKSTLQTCGDMLNSLSGSRKPWYSGQGLKGWADAAYFVAPLARTSKQQIVQGYGAYMDALVAQARLPYRVAKKTPLPRAPRDTISFLLLCTHNPLPDTCKAADTEMQDNLLTAVFALRAYQAEHGAYPEDLKALVTGGYLSRIPADPFSNTGDQPLLYRRQEDGTYLLYSVGPNGKDDGGKQIDNSKLHEGDSPLKKNSKYALPDSEGDMIAGLNF